MLQLTERKGQGKGKKKRKRREKTGRPHRTSQYPRQMEPLLGEEEQTILLQEELCK